MKRGFLTAFAILNLAFSCLVFPQQSSPKPQPTQPVQEENDIVRITTNLVQVDAVVTDKAGRLVTDLTAEDFEIKEDGRPQKITNLSFVSNATPAAARPVAANPANKVTDTPGPPIRLQPSDVRRTVALVVDDICLSWTSTVYVRKALRKFVDEEMKPGDLVAIMRTAGGIGILQQFTADRKQLHAAIERVQWAPRLCNRTEAFDQLNEDLQTPDFGIAPITGKSGRSYSSSAKDTAAVGRSATEFRNDVVTVGALGALSYIVRGLKELPGRKAVLFVSDGFKLFDKGNPGQTSEILEAVQRVSDLASRSSVVVYTMDARGLATSNFTASDRVSGSAIQKGGAPLILSRASELYDTQAGLHYLAQQAGGFSIYNTNDLSTGIKRVFDDQNGYYLIGYRPDESTFDAKTARSKFHKISVSVRRKDVSVRTRTGFYGVSEDDVERQATVTRAQPLVSAVTSPFEPNGMDVRLTTVFMNDAKTGSYLRSLLHIDARDLTFVKAADDWQQAVVDVLAVTFGDNGQVVDQVNKTETIQVRGSTYQSILRDGLVYFMNVPVKRAGAYQFRIAIRDVASKQIGSASQFVEVPEVGNKKLALSGLVISGETTASSFTSSVSEVASKPQEALVGTDNDQGRIDTQATAAVRRFHPGMTVNYAFLVYNARLNKTTRQPNVELQLRLFSNGKLVFHGQPQPLNNGKQMDPGMLASGGFQLGSKMQPGEYILQAVVVDRLAPAGKNTATQWIDFEVVN